MSQQVNAHPLAVEPVGKLLARFAVPSVISMVVNSLYNIVDQIFIAATYTQLSAEQSNNQHPGICLLQGGFLL